jgi:hypothetical protein
MLLCILAKSFHVLKNIFFNIFIKSLFLVREKLIKPSGYFWPGFQVGATGRILATN